MGNVDRISVIFFQTERKKHIISFYKIILEEPSNFTIFFLFSFESTLHYVSIEYFQNVIRGLHISTYCKLVTCTSGSVYDVVVDLRPDSPTYLQWAGAVLTAENCKELYIPPNCGHGFLSLEDDSILLYAQVSRG